MKKTTGDIIRDLRKSRGLTQEQLGDIVGVQKSAIAKYENNHVTNLKRETILKMADFFGVKPSYIMGMRNEEDAPVFLSAQEAVQFILEQPLVADFGGYDLERMTDEQKISFAEEVANMIQVMSKHYPRKDE